MAWAALVVSIVAVLIAGGSSWLAFRADGRAGRAERRSQRGWPLVWPSGGSGGPTDEYVQHRWTVRNGGQATISELVLWMEDAEGNKLSLPIAHLAALVPGDPPVEITLSVRQPAPEEQTLMVRWTDAEGTHTESTGWGP